MSRSAKFMKNSENGKLVRFVTKRGIHLTSRLKIRAVNWTKKLVLFSALTFLRSGHFVLISHFFSPLHGHVSPSSMPIEFFSHFSLRFIFAFSVTSRFCCKRVSFPSSHNFSCVLQMCDISVIKSALFCFVWMYARFVNFFSTSS